MIKRVFLFLGVLLLGFIVWNFDMVRYGIMQGEGQLKIIMNARPLDEVKADPNVSDSLKQKLPLVEAIKSFAFDSLGINYSKNYTTLYDQQGKPVLWVVTAAKPFALEAKEWRYPFLGKMAYKGYFVHEKALAEEEKLKSEGWETSVGTVSGWSTLGWLRDPLLSNMLFRQPGDLANLLIHELTHGTLFVKGNVDFNENLATFIGDKGAELFLISHFGKNSEELRQYLFKNHDRELLSGHILNGALQLDEMYKSFPEEMPDADKQGLKDKMISEIIGSADSLNFKSEGYSQRYFKGFVPNNTFFLSYLRYRAKQKTFEHEYSYFFKEDMPSYLDYLKVKYPSL